MNSGCFAHITHSFFATHPNGYVHVCGKRETQNEYKKNKHQRLQNQQPKMKQHNRIQNNHTCLNSTLNMFCFPALILIRYFTVEWTAWISTASHLSNAWVVIADQGNNCVWYFSISIQWNWTLFQHDALDFITKHIRPDSIYGLIFLWSRCIKCEYSDAVPNLCTRIMCVCVCVFRQKHPWCKTRTKHNF